MLLKIKPTIMPTKAQRAIAINMKESPLDKTGSRLGEPADGTASVLAYEAKGAREAGSAGEMSSLALARSSVSHDQSTMGVTKRTGTNPELSRPRLTGGCTKQ